MKKKIIPQVRFPQFRNTEGWEEKTLSQLGKLVTQKNKENKINRVLTNSAIDGIIDQRDYFDKDIANKDNLDGYYVVEFGDYVYNPRISNIAPVGPISKNKIGVGVMSPLYTVFRFVNKSNDFYEHYFKTSHWYKHLRYNSNTGARFDRMSITISDFMNTPLLCPSLPEQHKIAACLTSLDTLITAQSQKLAALKAHKKGLMQQLFPQEGEKVPQLRFKKWENTEGWKEMTLGEICSNISSGKDKSNVNGEYDLYGSTGIIGKTDSGNFDGHFILIARVGANAGQLNKVNRINKKFGVTDNTLVVYLDNTENIDFIFYLLDKLDLNKMVFGSGQPLITGGLLKALSINLPKPAEQSHIAACLTSLDGLIASETERLAAFKRHKVGLLQQLFPLAVE